MSDLLRRGKAESLIALLDSRSWRDRAQAAQALGELADERAVEALGRCLTHRNRRVREAAADALGSIPALRSVELLLVVFAEPFERVYANYESSQQARVILTAAASLARLRAVLGDLPEGLVTLLNGQLQTQQAEPRRLAVQAMGATGDPRFLRPLLAELKEATAQAKKRRRKLSEQMRPWHAAEALGRLGDRRAAELLASTIGDHDPNVREAAARALARLGDPRGIAYFHEVLDSDPGRRWVALSSLGKIGDDSTFPTVARYADRADWILRREAATALGRLGDERATPLLQELNDDPHEQVRAAARRSLDILAEHRTLARRRRYRQDRDARDRPKAADLDGSRTTPHRNAD